MEVQMNKWLVEVMIRTNGTGKVILDAEDVGDGDRRDSIMPDDAEKAEMRVQMKLEV